MLLPILLGVMTTLVLAVLLRPLFGRPADEAPRGAYDAAVFRDQLAELDRDVERGVLSAGEAALARLEVQRRLLAAAPAAAPAPSSAPPLGRAPWIAAAVIVILVPAIALPVYLDLGSPGMADDPLAGRGVERKLLAEDGSLDIDKARLALEARLAQTPESLEGWSLLARTDAALGRSAEAHAAYEKALALSKRSADLLADYGQLLVAEGDGTVSDAAVALFQEAVAKDPTAYTARYALGLAKAQRGDPDGAVALWQALLKDAPADASWIKVVKSAIADVESPGNAGTPDAVAAAPSGPSAGPPAEMAGIMSLPPEERLTAIRGMVAGLAAKLAENPKDIEGWRRLGRSYLVLGQPADAAATYAKALAQFPEDAGFALGRAQALRARGDGDHLAPETIAAYQAAARLNPDEPEALWYLGLAAHQSGDDAKAATLWRRLLSKLPPDSAEAGQVTKQLAALPPAK